jgi:hypothetical protein
MMMLEPVLYNLSNVHATDPSALAHLAPMYDAL